MKKLTLTLVLAAALLTTACGNSKVIDGVEYEVYGLMDKAEKMKPCIKYEISTGSVITAVVFSESIIIPGYIALFDLYQPEGKLAGCVVPKP